MKSATMIRSESGTAMGSQVVRVGVALACLAALGSCTTVKGWFGGSDDAKPNEPAELVEITPSANVSKLWTASAGENSASLGKPPTATDIAVRATHPPA